MSSKTTLIIGVIALVIGFMLYLVFLAVSFQRIGEITNEAASIKSFAPITSAFAIEEPELTQPIELELPDAATAPEVTTVEETVQVETPRPLEDEMREAGIDGPDFETAYAMLVLGDNLNYPVIINSVGVRGIQSLQQPRPIFTALQNYVTHRYGGSWQAAHDTYSANGSW